MDKKKKKNRRHSQNSFFLMNYSKKIEKIRITSIQFHNGKN